MYFFFLQGDNAKFNYTLVDNKGLFRVDPLTGIISVEDSTKLDRESDSSVIVTVSRSTQTAKLRNVRLTYHD